MRALVVEDQPDLLRTLARTLRENGYAVDESEDGEDGLSKALDIAYDVILLDVMLPRLDGWAFLKRLRGTRETPVLMLTARDAVADRIRGLDDGADDYLTKPCDLDELLARLRALVRRSAGRSTSSLELGVVALDMARREVTVSGESVFLTAREYSMLEFLALRRGEVVTRTMLYEHLFDEQENSMSNLIDVHICALRKKLVPDLIKTRRGMGYIIE